MIKNNGHGGRQCQDATEGRKKNKIFFFLEPSNDLIMQSCQIRVASKEFSSRHLRDIREEEEKEVEGLVLGTAFFRCANCPLSRFVASSCCNLSRFLSFFLFFFFCGCVNCHPVGF